MKQILRTNRILIVAFLLMPLFGLAAGQLDDYVFRILMLIGVNIVLASSLNLVNGITGQFSLGHAGFMAVGGYVSASLTVYMGRGVIEPWLVQFQGGAFSGLGTQLFFFAALLVGGLAAALLGFLVGVPSLRLRGDYLAIVTLGFGEIIRVMILNIESIGAATGFAGIPPFTNFYWVYGAVVVTLIVLQRLIRSAPGRAFLAVREDEVAAEAVGISTTRAKVTAFVVSSFFAGIAGGLFAHYLSYLNPSIFTFLKSFEIITMVVLGGMGSLTGSIISAAVLTILPEALRPLSQMTKVDLRMVIYSLLLVILMLTRPNGLFGKKEIWEYFRKKGPSHG